MKACVFLVLLLCPAGRATALEDVSLVEPSNEQCNHAGPGKDGSCSTSMIQTKQLKEKAQFEGKKQEGVQKKTNKDAAELSAEEVIDYPDELDDQHTDPPIEEELDDQGENVDLLAKEVAETGEVAETASESGAQLAPLLAGMFIRGMVRVAVVGIKAGSKAFFKKVNKGQLKAKLQKAARGLINENTLQYIEQGSDVYQLYPRRTVEGCVTNLRPGQSNYVYYANWCQGPDTTTKSGCEFYAKCKWADIFADSPDAHSVAYGALVCRANRRSHGRCNV